MNKIKCRSCGYEGATRFLSLGSMPPVNAFIKQEQIKDERKYPLNLSYCPNCFLVQLEEVVPPEELFRNYLHLSAGSETNVQHLKRVAEHLNKRFNVDSSTKILEIGSNDGTLLSFFKERSQQVLGVDPAKNLIELNRKKGIDYISEFFDTKTASEILNERGKFDLIVALNVIPHTPENIDLLKAARIVLQDNGTLVMEGVYALETILAGEFDTIYHEHVYTFSLRSLISTFGMAGLTIVDVEKIPTQGGSLRVYAMKNEFALPISNAVTELLTAEKNLGLCDSKTYYAVEQKVESYKKNLRKIVEDEIGRSGKLIGLGAPARGVVILNFCGIGTDEIEYIVDDTSLKHDKVVPGVHIPVRPFDALKDEKNRTFFLLSWNYKESFLKRMASEFSKFRLIVPFPKPEVIEYG